MIQSAYAEPGYMRCNSPADVVLMVDMFQLQQLTYSSGRRSEPMYAALSIPGQSQKPRKAQSIVQFAQQRSNRSAAQASLLSTLFRSSLSSARTLFVVVTRAQVITSNRFEDTSETSVALLRIKHL